MPGLNRLRRRASRWLSVLIAVFCIAILTSGCSLLDRLKARDHVNKGVKAYSVEDYETAVKEFQAAVDLDPTLVDAELYLAHSYRAQYIPGSPRPEVTRNADLAIATFEEVVKKDPENINAMATIASLYDTMEQPEKAVEWYERRAGVEPDNPEPYYGIGRIRYNQAEKITGTDGTNVSELTDEQRSEAASLVDQGMDQLRKAIELDDEYANAYDYLNLMYRQRSYLSETPEEAERWDKEAIQLALKVADLRKKQKLEEEKERHKFFKDADGD